MKNLKKTILVIFVLILAAAPVFSMDLAKLQENLGGFTDNMATALPFNSSIGLNWSDAYIGQLLAVPPHFGIGVTTGFTTMKFDAINGLLDMFGESMPLSDVDMLKNIGLPLPAYTVDARIGGIIKPFDIGIKAGYIPPDLMGNMFDSFDNFGLNYLLVGADFRYSLINKKILPIRLSVGLGVNYLQGGINTSISGENLSFKFTDTNDDEYTLFPGDVNMGLEWKTVSAELKAHVSFPFKIVTPYAGVGISYARSEAGLKFKSDISIKDNSDVDVDLKDVEEILKGYGLSGITAQGFESMNKLNGFNTRIYGGTSFNMIVIRLDLTAMYEIIGNNLGATIGLRFQL